MLAAFFCGCGEQCAPDDKAPTGTRSEALERAASSDYLEYKAKLLANRSASANRIANIVALGCAAPR